MLETAYAENKHNSVIAPMRTLGKFEFSTLIDTLGLLEYVITQDIEGLIANIKVTLN